MTSTTSPLGIGVIGVGAMGRRHAENAASRVAGARLVAVFDPAHDVARRVAGDLGATACTSMDELAARGDVEAIVIASPSRLHAEHAVTALRAGKDVLLEKPMAHTLADCDRVLEAARTADARLQLGFMRRYDTAYAEAHRLVASGRLGAPRLFKAVHRDREPADLPASAGVSNMLLESAIHDFDLARWLMASEVARVGVTAAVLCHDACGHAPNGAVVTLELASGALGEVETYRGARYAYDVRTEVVCADGTVVVGSPQQANLTVLTPAGARHDLVPGFLDRFADAYVAELRDFVAGARERRPPAVNGRDGRAAVAVALAGCAAHEAGRTVSVSG